MSAIYNIILLGNPNVGKSAFFSRLTGTRVISGNFPGTTISVTQGTLEIPCPHSKTPCVFNLIDIPGIYSLKEKSKTAQRGLQFILEQADLVINILDATNLRRNLYLTEQLKQISIKKLGILNLWDEAKYHGIDINTDTLKKHLGFSVIKTVSTSGVGITEVRNALSDFCSCDEPEISPPVSSNIKIATDIKTPSWQDIKKIIDDVQTVTPRSKKLGEYLATLTLKPFWGTVIAVSILSFTLFSVFYLTELAEDIIHGIFSFCFDSPLLFLHKNLSSFPFLQSFLVGEITNNSINYGTAMGLLTTGIYIPLGQVAPAVTAFYLVMGILEDGGYLPRLALLSDTLMHKYSLHGFALIPMVLGAGCNVTGIVGTRILENRQQRIITSALMAITIPCASQTGFIAAMTEKMGGFYTGLIFLTLASTWHIMGLILGASQQENYQELLVEIPPLRLPRLYPSLHKLSYRVKNFLLDAIPITIMGIGVLLLCNYFEIFEMLGKTIFSFLGTLWGLPHEVIPALFMGLFRKEIALSFLKIIPDLTQQQAFVSTLLLTLWFPCISVYTILYKEFGGKTLGYLVLLMLGVSTSIGIIAHTIINTFG